MDVKMHSGINQPLEEGRKKKKKEKKKFFASRQCFVCISFLLPIVGDLLAPHLPLLTWLLSKATTSTPPFSSKGHP